MKNSERWFIIGKTKKEKEWKQKQNKNKNKTKQSRVWLSRTGCEWSPIHRCYPTTVWRGSFCLLCFHPGRVRSSLTNLENSDSSVFTILTPNLARTPDLHRVTTPRNPAVKPFNDPSLQVTGLQACATTPGWWNISKFNRSSLDCPPEVKSLVLNYQNTLRFPLKTLLPVEKHIIILKLKLNWTSKVVFSMMVGYSYSPFGLVGGSWNWLRIGTKFWCPKLGWSFERSVSRISFL